MTSNPFESSAQQVVSSPSPCTIESLVEEITGYIQSRGDYADKTISYGITTWRQFQKYCESEGFEFYSSECGDSFIRSLSTRTPPLAPKTIRYKESYLKILDQYFKNGTWEKGVLDSEPEFTKDFSSFITSLDGILKKHQYSDHTRETYRKQASAMLSHFQDRGIQRFLDITCDSITAYTLSLRGHAKSTLRCELSRIRQIMHNAYLLGYTEEDLSGYVPNYNLGHPQSHVKIWQSSEITKVLEVVDRSNPKGLRDAAYITIASELGMRSKDIADLKLTDFDWEACSVSFIQSKTGKANQLPLNEKTGRAIIDYLQVRPETDCEYLFVKLVPPYGKMKSLGSSFTRYVNRSGVVIPTNAHHNLHSLRATVATRLLEKGVSPDDIFSFLGHSDRESLRDYIRMDIENLRSCALSFEDGEFV